MSELPFKTEVALAFDPANSEGKIEEVFADPIARSIWLAVKSGHIVNRHFNEGCLIVATWIKNFPTGKLNRGEFIRRTVAIMTDGFTETAMLGPAEQEFGTALIGYILDGGEIRYAFPATGTTAGEGGGL